ncbi:nicotinate-nucleotide--dimethylbenzimidazole phosphoribosyltransferase [Reinekea sp.]|jgi:nicotinate-nucleotide--dimethylbenzimidazole phosphoribosyltransferase|uniref:nicotinate-nucleotide--dimethylbenzimidazole phosphoribosyltransferase n=1 Tax=Reinekea sp. TaxID=1970455 RepID=UPI00398929EE
MQPSFTINPVDASKALELDHFITNLGLPEQSLGNLVTVVEKLACIQQTLDIDVGQLSHMLFCADHGVYERSHASSPQLTSSTDHINRLLKTQSPLAKACDLYNIDLTVIDCGLETPIDNPHENFLESSIAPGTRDFSMMPAMTPTQFNSAMNVGKEIAQLKLAEGARVLSFGVLGLGSTTSAAAITSNLLGLSAEACIKNHNRFNAQLTQDKLLIVTQGLMLHRDSITDGYSTVEKLGGFEIAAIMGAMAITAELGGLFLVDGYACSAALLALSIHYPAIIDYALFTHQSVHAGQAAICQHFKQKPLLNLGLAIGEGTGSVLAWPLISATVICLKND